MAQSTAKYMAQFSELVMQTDEKRKLCEEIQREIEPLMRSKLIVVDGEVSRLNELQTLLDQALQERKTLGSVKNLQEAGDELRKLRDLLSDVRWELADDLKDSLRRKREIQNQIISQYQTRIGEWPNLVRDLRDAILKAIRVRAPIRLDYIELRRLDSQVSQVQRAFDEGLYAGLEELLNQLDKSSVKEASYLKRIQDDMQEAQNFIRQADLLLLKSPLDSRSINHYTVLLRTASEPGSHGINIRDYCALVEQDRNEWLVILKKITEAIDRGLARDFHLSKSRAQEQPEAATPAVADGQTAGGQTRRVDLDIPEDSPFSSVPSQNLNDLLKDLGDMMYRIFMSDQMQSYIYETPCSLTITTNDLILPWELMSYKDKANSDTDKFLCLERPIARMPMGSYFPRRYRSSREKGKPNFLLIYADPKGNLPFAKKEVQRIHDSLKESWKDHVDIKIVSQEQATGRALNEALRKDTYDVIHFAGHAFFNEEDGDLSGLLLHADGNEKGKEEYFLAQKIRRLLDGRPLVFLNACESGFTANENEAQRAGLYLQKPAEGLASAFIYGGAVGCVGSIWPIYDEPAAEFAVHFYDNVLKGHMIGQAMRLARRKIKESYPNQITWAAYVLYGDPTYQL